jgi:polyferredoxin
MASQEQLFNIIGLIYAVLTVTIAYFLLRTGRMRKNAAISIIFITTIVGFVLTAPLIPFQMQLMLLGRVTGAMTLPVLLAVIGLLIISSYFIGRIFCGYACPIGALHELVYRLPGKKIMVKGRKTLLVHASFVLLFFLGGVFSFSLLGSLGVRQFFQLDPSSFPFFIFLALGVLSIFIYRPFCRFICPFGFFSEILAERSLMTMGRGKGCNSCRVCEKICPAGVNTEKGSGGNCFLCVRCDGGCKKGAMKYSRRRLKR